MKWLQKLKQFLLPKKEEISWSMPPKKAYFVRKHSIPAVVAIYLTFSKEEVATMHPTIKLAWRIGKNVAKGNPEVEIQLPRYYAQLKRELEP